MEPQREARDLLLVALTTPGEGRPRNYSIDELQAFCGAYYENYQAVVAWLHQIARLCAPDLATRPEYALWKQEDDRFLTELRRLISRPPFEVLGREVRRVGWGEGIRLKAAKIDGRSSA
jgi:hypothetical protein